MGRVDAIVFIVELFALRFILLHSFDNFHVIVVILGLGSIEVWVCVRNKRNERLGSFDLVLSVFVQWGELVIDF